MNCLIVDDNPIARATLCELASQLQTISICAECANAMDAFNYLQEKPVDLIFLDIEMPGMSGLELIRNLGQLQPVIIFTTSKKDYAVEAFELDVADYLVKPLRPARFIQAINRANEILASKKMESRPGSDEYIFIRDTNVVRRLKLDDILFAEAMGDYVKLYTQEKLYAIHTKLKTVEERLPSCNFLRVHRSYIVALNKIDAFQDGALKIGSKFLPVTDTYRKILNERMNIL
ncbi:LytTR family DNA-binding domain-containing protein [Pedobacter sp. MC2016-15]|uniref:LytR/AlgR family response regulator transcription factor n=1 Tax=Pedobacter sp. MC2016-15 TaxID=2994473 RepID=UPI002245301D|nr:LytTR family DNA-binding domain-containing protein [Pedobacter sp. MC2016-15]MCX2480576.1 LytTR family DNA-binding domain-containing protein [Pedobacter sp. MC2016-15]